MALPATVTSITPRRSAAPAAGAAAPPRPRPFRDNPRLILAGIVVLVARAGRRCSRSPAASPRSRPTSSPSSSSTRSRPPTSRCWSRWCSCWRATSSSWSSSGGAALPFARFRAKLVALLLGMTLVPAVLVLIVGSELIRTSVDRWFNAPMDEMLSSANQIAGDYYQRAAAARRRSGRAASRATLGGGRSDAAPTSRPIRDLLAPDVTLQRVQMVEVYRVGAVDRRAAARRAGRRRRGAGAAAGLQPRRRPTGWRRRRSAGSRRDAIDRDARQRRRSARTPRPSSAPNDGRPTGVVVATDYLTGELAARSRRMTQAFESYKQLRVLKRPLTGVYLSFFLMVTLMILVGATWMGLYLAKRITRPVQMLAAAAREIGAGRLDQRVEPQSNDEFGSLIEAFNAMAGELADQPPQARALDDRARAQAPRGRRPPPLHRDDPRAHRHRRGLGRRRGRDHARSTARRRGCSASTRRVVGQPARGGVRRAGSASRSATLLDERGARHDGRRPRRRSRSRATGASCTSPWSTTPLRRRRAARPRAWCWCSTT